MLVLLILCSCNVDGPSSVPAGKQVVATTQQTIRTFRMRWPARTAADAWARAASVAEVIAGAKLPSSTAGTLNRWGKPFASFPDVVVSYDASHDDLRVFDSAKLSTFGGNDVGFSAAQAEMLKVFQELAQRGITNSAHYDTATAKVSYVRSGVAAKGTAPNMAQVTEYRFGMLRLLNGIAVANAGLVIGIHRSGSPSSIRLGGVEVDSTLQGTTEEPVGGSVSVRTVSDTDIEKQFAALPLPTGADRKVLWKRLLYVLPDGAKDALVEPLLVFHSARRDPDGAGDYVVSRAKDIGFSVTNAAATPTDLSPKFTVPAPSPPK